MLTASERSASVIGVIRSLPTSPTDLRLGQLLTERLNLLAQLADDAGVGVLVDDGVVDDALGAVGVAQGGQRLLVVVCRWADGGHHHRLAVPAQVVLPPHHTATAASAARQKAYDIPHSLQ